MNEVTEQLVQKANGLSPDAKALFEQLKVSGTESRTMAKLRDL